MRRRSAGLFVVVLAALPGAALADQEPPKTPSALPARTAQLATEKGIVKLTVSFRDVIDPEIAQKLQSGLPTVVTMRGYVFRETGGDPIALAAKSCRIVYDLWDEVFRIQLAQPGGPTSAVAVNVCLLYTSPSPRDGLLSRMPSSA